MFAAVPDRLRSAMFFLAALAAMATVVYITYGYGILPQLNELEQEVAYHHCEQIQTHVALELDRLSALVKDYTRGEMPHGGVTSAKESWAQHLSRELLHHHGLDEAAVYDKRGALVFNLSATSQNTHDTELCRKAFNLTQLSARSAVHGLLRSDQGLSLVAAGIVESGQEGQPGQTVVLLRRLTPQVLADWSRRLRVQISLVDLALIENHSSQQLNRLLQQPQHPDVSHIDGAIQATTLLFDISNTPVAQIDIMIPQQSYIRANGTLIVVLLLAALVLTFIISLTSRQSSRLARQPFHDLVGQIRQWRQQGATLPVGQQAVTADLTREINGLFEELGECRRNQTLSEVRTNLIKQVVPCAIFTVDHRRVITSWNDRAEQLTGYSADEMIGSSCYRFALSPCHRQCGLFNQQQTKPVMGRECTIRHKNGALLTISKNADLLRDSGGEVIGGIECFVDITHHKRDEQALQWEVSLNSRLASLSHAIVQQHADQYEVARQLLSHARNLTGSQHGFIAALGPGGNQSLWDFTSLFEEFSVQGNTAIIPAAASGRGSLLHAVYNRKTGVYFNDLKRLNIAHLAGGIKKPFHHFMAVPVDNGERIVGQVALANNEDGYSVRDLQAIEQLAELFAVFLAQRSPTSKTA